MATVTSETVWLIALLKTSRLNHTQLAFLYCDSKDLCTLLQIQYTMKEQNKLRLIVTSLGRKFKMVIKTFHIPTRHQIADFFTKAPGQKQFFYLLSKMNLINIYSSS